MIQGENLKEMSDADNANAFVRPPIALLLAFVAGLAIDWFYPMRFVPTNIPGSWVGAAVFVLGLTLALWALATFRAAGTRVETYKATTTIVVNGPYRFTRNPIYVGMFFGLVGLAIGCNSLWILAALVPFFLIIRFGVVAREENYLERKFGGAYLVYRTRVRRWL
jgi:protein-S-isoprenylcysteine O-methyltransferase Ste14